MQDHYYKNSEYSKLYNEDKLNLHQLCENNRHKPGTSANDKDSAKIAALEENDIALEEMTSAIKYKKGGGDMDNTKNKGEDESIRNEKNLALNFQPHPKKRKT